jgi:uncharacterized radical SAM superfamily protein
VPGLLIACGRCGGEVFAQLVDVRSEIHDVKHGVMDDVSQGTTDVAVSCGAWSRARVRGVVRRGPT